MCDRCLLMVRDAPASDWKVSHVLDRGAGHYYRYQVTGENLNWPEGLPEREFVWSVPSIDDPRYDLSTATFTTQVLA